MADYTSSIFILLADDDAGDCILFKDAIDQLKQNVSIEVCNNGFTLMKYLNNPKNQLPDFIFLDLNMPLKSGIECLEEIRSDERLKDLCVIIYSVSSMLENIQTTLDKGANLYFSKSSTFQELVNRLKRILAMDWDEYNSTERKEKFVLVDDAGF